ncbi:type II toxin-antitoxin system RelE/ParE family toxin [Bacteroides fragilis]
MKRELIFSPEYIEFEQSSTPRTHEKLRYAVAILETVQPIPTKFVKKLTNTDFYELRVSVDNEVRVILFAADNENINLASSVVLLNGFVKKSTKDYDKEITKAINILRKLL